MLEASARCQNIVALEVLLREIFPPEHPLLRGDEGADGKLVSNDYVEDDEDDNTDTTKQPSSETFLVLLLSALDTASLPSYFWRSLASSLSPRVSEILSRGGVAARTLRSQRDTVRAEIRECVLRGSKMPRSILLGDPRTPAKGDEVVENWEREAAVMVGSVVGLLGR